MKLHTFSLCLLVLLSSAATAAPKMPDVTFQRVFEKLAFKRPIYLTHQPDDTDHIYIVEQHGRIVWFENDPEVAKSNVAIDISDKVFSPHNGGFNEEGLIGFAFDPNFKANGFVYLHYSIKKPRGNVLSRFKMDAKTGVIDPKSEQQILTLDQPFPNHNGGHIDFGPDGFLYVSLGDGGSAGDPRNYALDRSNWLGTILRIDVHKKQGDKNYAVPDDNPFIGQEGVKPEIWAYGLRNVWRFSFDRKTGDLYAADVGQDKWEEINLITKGGNFGWRQREGKHPYDKEQRTDWPDDEKPIDPIAEYSHGLGQSVTGGYVYRGKQIPEMDGYYVFGDYQRGVIFMIKHNRETGETTEPYLFEKLNEISSFGEDREGEMYLLSLQGPVYKLVKREKK